LIDELLTFCGHDQTPGRALENDRLESGFELAHLHGEGGLGDVTPLGRLDEAAKLRNGDGVFEIAKREARDIHHGNM
jgi:hypothetical protein